MARFRAGAVLGVLLLATSAQAARTDNVNELVQQVLGGPSVAADRAAERLRFLGPDKAGPALRIHLMSPDQRTRAAVTSALVIVRDPGSVKLLQKLVVEDEFWEVRRNAANGLGAMKAKGATSALEKALRTDSKTVVRSACIRALDKIGGGAGALADAVVKESELELRLAALDAIAHQKNKSVRGKLRPLMSDSSELIRFASARALAWQDDAEARKFLEKAVSATESDVARRAITASSDVPSAWAVKLFERGMSHTDLGVQVAAAQELAKRKDARGTRFLAKMSLLSGPEADAAKRALDSLGIGAADRARLAAESL